MAAFNSSKTINLSGMRFGRLTVLGRSQKTSNAGAVWHCVCDCGGEAHANSLKLRTGHTQSCGCLRPQVSSVLNLTHGSANKSITYRSWKEMRQRCKNPNSDKWKWYGGRGISVCPEWDDYTKFLADMGERPVGTSIDRIDPDGNYCKENCRWATAKQQAETNRGLFKPGHGLRTVEKVKGVAR